MSPMTPTRRFAGSAVLFAMALVCLALASATHEAWPLFVAWIPLIGVPWLLTRPEPGAKGREAIGADRAEGTVTSGDAGVLERASADDLRSHEEPDSR